MYNPKPLVSILVNCHNGERYLKDCLQSIVAQTYKNWEVIFWDNNSTDNSAKIFKSYKNQKFNYFLSKKFTTLYAARNSALLKAKGKYISFLDTDDKWSKNKLKLQVEYLEKYKNYKMVYSNYMTLDSKKKIKKTFNYFLPSGKITQSLLKKYCIGILTVLIKKEIFKKIKFEKKYNIIGDFDFFIRLSLKHEIAAIQKPLAVYRIHDKNLSLKKIDLYKEEIKNWLKNKKKSYIYLDYSLISIKYLLLKLNIKFFFKRYLF